METFIIHVAVCALKGSQTCDKAVVTAACHALRSTGITVPQGCPTEVTIKKERINVIAHCFCCHNFLGQINA